MSTLLIGADGNMGRRYRAIFNYLNEPFTPLEIGYTLPRLKLLVKGVSHVVVASASNAHIDNLWDLSEVNCTVPILCEKPVVTLPEHLDSVLSYDLNLYVVNQYQHLVPEGVRVKNATYDYYNTGRDGIFWDCFQLFAIAEQNVTLRNKSPYWTCIFDQYHVPFALMDLAYIQMIRDFLGEKKRVWGKDVIERTTKRIFEICKTSL